MYVRTLPDEGWGRGGPFVVPHVSELGSPPPALPLPLRPCRVPLLPPSPPSPASRLPLARVRDALSIFYVIRSSPPLGICGSGLSEGTRARVRE